MVYSFDVPVIEVHYNVKSIRALRLVYDCSLDILCRISL